METEKKHLEPCPVFVDYYNYDKNATNSRMILTLAERNPSTSAQDMENRYFSFLFLLGLLFGIYALPASNLLQKAFIPTSAL